MKTTIIFNPASGFGNNAPKKKLICNYLEKNKIAAAFFETSRKKSAADIAKETIANGTKKIIICGGDGTILEALPEILNAKVTLGIVPLGTGNLFAQNLDIDLDITKALEIAIQGKTEKIDIGKANETYFAIMTGIGFDAEIMKKANTKLKSKYGFFAYIVTGLKHLKRRSGSYQITIDGGKPKKVKAKSIVVANMGKIQGGIEAVPSAHSKNGMLHIGVIRASSVSSWLNLLANALTGNIHKSPHYDLYKGKTIEILSVKGSKPYECDGNYFNPTKVLRVEIYPRILSVMVKK